MASEALAIGRVLQLCLAGLREVHPMELLPQEIRDRLPPLDCKGGTGGQAIAHIKYFTPDAGWTWYVMQGQPEGADFLFFGLVEGLERELGYFRLSELEGVRGPMGLPVERDLYWQPRPLCEIAPDIFPPARFSEPA